MRGLIVLYLLAAATAQAQTPQQTLAKVAGYLRRLGPDLEVRMDYVLYATHTTQMPLDRIELELRRSGARSHLRLGDVSETYMDERYTLMADHENQALWLGPRYETPASPVDPAALTLGLDTLLTYGACTTTLPAAGRVEAVCADFPYTRFVVEYDTADYAPKRMIFYTAVAPSVLSSYVTTPMRIELTFRSLRASGGAADRWPLDVYLRREGGGFVPRPAYAHYRFIDQTP